MAKGTGPKYIFGRLNPRYVSHGSSRGRIHSRHRASASAAPASPKVHRSHNVRGAQHTLIASAGSHRPLLYKHEGQRATPALRDQAKYRVAKLARKAKSGKLTLQQQMALLRAKLTLQTGRVPTRQSLNKALGVKKNSAGIPTKADRKVQHGSSGSHPHRSHHVTQHSHRQTTRPAAASFGSSGASKWNSGTIKQVRCRGR
jgi:hypothetical protein